MNVNQRTGLVREGLRILRATEQKENSRKHANFNDNILTSKDANSAGTGELKETKLCKSVYLGV